MDNNSTGIQVIYLFYCTQKKSKNILYSEADATNVSLKCL